MWVCRSMGGPWVCSIILVYRLWFHRLNILRLLCRRQLRIRRRWLLHISSRFTMLHLLQRLETGLGRPSTLRDTMVFRRHMFLLVRLSRRPMEGGSHLRLYPVPLLSRKGMGIDLSHPRNSKLIRHTLPPPYHRHQNNSNSRSNNNRHPNHHLLSHHLYPNSRYHSPSASRASTLLHPPQRPQKQTRHRPSSRRP